jgi:hypothetical protein
MKRPEALSVAAGLLVAILVLGRALSAPEHPPMATDPMPGQARAEVQTSVEVEAPLPDITDVPESVADVLARAGNAEFMPSETLVDSLPESVVITLVEAGATLRIPEGSP